MRACVRACVCSIARLRVCVCNVARSSLFSSLSFQLLVVVIIVVSRWRCLKRVCGLSLKSLQGAKL